MGFEAALYFLLVFLPLELGSFSSFWPCYTPMGSKKANIFSVGSENLWAVWRVHSSLRRLSKFSKAKAARN